MLATLSQARLAHALTGAALAALLLVASAHADDAYPDGKPITLVIPFGAGGSVDTMGRVVAQGLEKRLGTTILVENKPGAGGQLGFDQVRRAAPDGYTLINGTPNSFVPALSKTLSFDIMTDFTFVSSTYRAAMVLVAKSSSPFKSIEQLVDYAKSKDRVTIGYPGAPSVLLVIEMLNSSAGIELVPVPYKSSSEITTAVLAGEIDLALDAPLPYVERIRDGSVLGIAVTSNERLSAVPDVPTTAESGFEKVLFKWHTGILGPAGIPDAITAKISKAIQETIADPEIREKMQKAAYDPYTADSEQFRAITRQEVDYFQESALSLGFQPR